MVKEFFSSSWFFVLIIILLAELVLSAPQGYNYYANQQRFYYAQRAAQAQRVQAQRLAAQNRYYQQSYRTTTTRRPYRVSKADSGNSKFLGSQNQESIGSEKTFKRKQKKQFGPGYGAGYGPGVGNGCYFRNANQPKSEGRVFWDFNVYNVYPNGGGCGGGYPGGYGGGGGFGGGYADPVYSGRPIRGFFQNWLGLFLPGGALSGVNRPYQGPSQSQFQSQLQSQQSSSQTDPVDYDASLGSTGSGADTSTTNVGFDPDSASGSGGGGGTAGGNNNFGPNNGGMANLTPGQLVGGVANTVNSVIQTLSSAPVLG